MGNQASASDNSWKTVYISELPLAVQNYVFSMLTRVVSGIDLHRALDGRICDVEDTIDIYDVRDYWVGEKARKEIK